MKLEDLSGKVRSGKLTTDHPSSSYGQAVLVVGKEALGTLDVLGWTLIEATEKDRLALQRAGYVLQGDQFDTPFPAVDHEIVQLIGIDLKSHEEEG